MDELADSDSDNCKGLRCDIIRWTEQWIGHWMIGDFHSFKKMVHPTMTCFSPETCGKLIRGVEFHKFYFDNVLSVNTRPCNTFLLNPYVRVLNKEAAACIAFTRLTQYIDSNAMQGSNKRKAAAHACHEDAAIRSPIATKRPRSTLVQLIDRKQADNGRQHAATPTAAATECDENRYRPTAHGKLRVSMPPRRTGTRASTKNKAKENVLKEHKQTNAVGQQNGQRANETTTTCHLQTVGQQTSGNDVGNKHGGGDKHQPLEQTVNAKEATEHTTFRRKSHAKLTGEQLNMGPAANPHQSKVQSDAAQTDSSEHVTEVIHEQGKAGQPLKHNKDVDVLAVSLGVIQLADNKLTAANKNTATKPIADWINVDHVSEDIFNYCYSLEKRNTVCSDFLHPTPSQVSGHVRAILVDWMIQVQEHLSLLNEVLHLSVALVDLFLSRQQVSNHRAQLVGIACLFIAAKYEQRIILSVDELVYLTDNSFTTAELLTMERSVLKVLRFDLSVTTSVMFASRHLQLAKQVCNKKSNDDLPLAEMLTHYFLELALVDASFSSVRSSLKCAAAVSLSLNVVGMMSVQQCWSLGLKLISYTDLRPAELEACMCRMSRMLLRATEASDSQIQGAFKKYTQGKYRGVSKYPGLAVKIAYALTHIPYDCND